jgi:hypothetical protein
VIGSNYYWNDGLDIGLARDDLYAQFGSQFRGKGLACYASLGNEFPGLTAPHLLARGGRP